MSEFSGVYTYTVRESPPKCGSVHKGEKDISKGEIGEYSLAIRRSKSGG